MAPAVPRLAAVLTQNIDKLAFGRVNLLVPVFIVGLDSRRPVLRPHVSIKAPDNDFRRRDFFSRR